MTLTQARQFIIKWQNNPDRILKKPLVWSQALQQEWKQAWRIVNEEKKRILNEPMRNVKALTSSETRKLKPVGKLVK